MSLNLLAVNGPDNQAKGDSTPSDWLRPDPAYRCFYAGKYLPVAKKSKPKRKGVKRKA